jgi:Leucine-rich repeat (LRR) protein
LQRTNLNGIHVDFLGVLTNLVFIDLSDNFIRFNETFLANSLFLEGLTLSNVNLTTDVFEMYIRLKMFEFLRYLNLSHNHLETVKSEYFTFNRLLNKINLSFNKIKVIENESFKWSHKIVVLDLTSNVLMNFTTSLSGLQGTYPIKELFLSDNLIRLYDCLLEDIELLDLSGGGLKKLPYSVSLSSHLKITNMDKNNIDEIKNNSLNRLTYLENLYFSSNRLSNIAPFTFYKLNALNELDLSRNLLSNLEDETFHGLFSLSLLNLSSNSIRVIRRSIFKDLLNLAELDMNRNPIISIQDNSFISLRNQQYLRLDSFNPTENKTSITKQPSIKTLIAL